MTSKSRYFVTLIVLAILCPVLQAQSSLLEIETTLVDAKAIHGATFQSNNQKVVRTEQGIFMTHLHSRNEKYTAQEWWLSQSKDGGRTFSTVQRATDPTNPPMLEADSAGNLYVGHPDFVSLEVVLRRFLRKEEFREAHTSRSPKAAAGKHAMAVDEPRKLVYYFSHSGVFVRFGLDGAVISSTNLLVPGKSASLSYPHLHLDPRTGVLHAAWTTFNTAKRVYWSIHYLQSPDGGTTWQTMKRTPVKLPMPADESGPSERITLDDEFDVSSWLSNFLVHDGKVHFLYMARCEPVRQHYVRYDLNTGTRDFDRQPQFRGTKLGIRGLDGFFAADPRKPNGMLYCVGHDERDTRLVCLASDDNGTTWRDHAVSKPFTRPYAIGGCREVTPEGWILGAFTDVITVAADSLEGRVHFLRIAPQNPQPESRDSKQTRN